MAECRNPIIRAEVDVSFFDAGTECSKEEVDVAAAEVALGECELIDLGV